MKNRANKKSYPVFFLNHEFLIPLVLFIGMMATERVEIILNVLGFRIYDSSSLTPLLYYAGTSYIAVIYSFRSFQRWSRFRLSQNNPVLNMFLNLLIVGMPMVSIVICPLFLFVLLLVHWFSHMRSPNVEEAKGYVAPLSRTHALIWGQIFLLFFGFFIVSNHVRSLGDLVFWGWLSS